MLFYIFAVNLPYSMGVKLIYAVFDWEKNFSGALVLTCILILETLIVELIFVGVSRLKMRCIDKYDFIQKMK